MTETTVTQRDPRLARYDTFAEVQNEIAARITIAQDCYEANKATGDDKAALVAFGRLMELRGLSAALAWRAAGWTNA